MARRTRTGVLALLGTASLLVGAASLSWACGPSGYGVPETPAAPPASAQPVAPPVSATPPAARNVPQSPAVRVEVGSGSVRSVATDPGSQPPSTDTRASDPPRTPPGRVGPVSGNTGPATQGDIAARVAGQTAGVVEQGGQKVFASSAAPGSAKAKGKKAAAARKKAAKDTQAPSQRTAVADLWTGVSGSANLASAASAGATDSGPHGGVIAAVAMLGLGLVGLTGAVLVAGRRRRAGAAAGAPKNQ